MWKILAVDDEAIERRTLKEILDEHLGAAAEVRTAADGLSAVEIATLWKADLVLMDIEMPGMNGIKAAGSIRRALPACQIIFLTAYGLFEYAQEAIRLGAQEYILKPAEDEEILAAVEKALCRRRAINAGAAAQAELSAQAVAAEAAGVAPLAESAPPADKTARLMEQVRAYLEANFAHDISLDGLAQTLDYSPYYLSKLIKQSFGTSFIEYLTDLRVAAAKEYLADATKSAKEIGELVGYPNSNYFVKMFKKKTGITPTEYRSRL